MTRPARIDQIIPSIVEHDAVSTHTFGAQRLLREMGFESEIYADIIGPGTEARVHRLGELPVLDDGSQWLLYQSSIGSRAADVFARHPGTKLLDYHNITPAELVERWIPPLADEARLGRVQLARLAPLVSFSFADSPFNAAELKALHYRGAQVVPVLADLSTLSGEPDRATRDALRTAKRDGGLDWLFVGQLAPHKAQHDLIKAFACYRRVFDANARLYLVGREMGETYRRALRGFIDLAGLSEAVILTGAVPSAALAAHYESADVFVCCSNHEGFNVPVIEAMTRGLPVIAYRAGALADTVGEAGILLDEKTPEVVAAAVQVLRGDETLRTQLVEAGRARAGLFSLSASEAAFIEAIEAALALA